MASDLASCVFQLIEKRMYGVFNISSDSRLSKYEFAVLVAKICLPHLLVKPISIHEKSDLVLRPTDMSLSNKGIGIVDATNRLCRGWFATVT